MATRRRLAFGPKPRRRTRANQAAETRQAAVPAVVTIRIGPQSSLDVPRSERIVRIAAEWTYILRSRSRWADDDDIREIYRERALDDLGKLGVTRAFMRRMVGCQHAEVELHPWNPADGAANLIHEAAAELPWEYLLSAGTRGMGRHGQLLITRLFRNEASATIPGAPREVLFVESAPGRIGDFYEFESERRRISAAIGADGDTIETAGRQLKRSETQNLTALRKAVRSKRWDVLHVTGVDTHQAAWQLPGFYDQPFSDIEDRVFDNAGTVRDGMILREENIAELPVPFDDLAATLINPANPPALVTLNLYYSGARTARELVKQGAQTAIGFLDEVDDEQAERFFQQFYWAWCQPKKTEHAEGWVTIPQAIMDAWENMPGNGLHGTAFVIWMGRSVYEEFRVPRRIEAPPPLPAEGAELARRSRLKELPIRSLLNVDVDIDEEVNYSLLHNDRPLLNTLTLTRLVKDPLEDISVQVELNLGAQNYPFRCTELVLDQPQLAMAPSVVIPLTAALPRSLRERVKSTVYTKVTCDGRVAHESTHRVTLIPVDEWVDDTNNNPWLPSFVLPRDPAILAIVTTARRYLIGIRDDPEAGFDGYQSIDDGAEDPGSGVDAQVQALWTALVNEYRLQYINPPPAYSTRNQRLRTPTDIVGSNSGTCIDLALLLASCLEYIDINAVLVLQEGHAFVGYWRSEVAYDAFATVEQIPEEVPAIGSIVARTAAVRFVDAYGWRLTRLYYDEIMKYVTSGDLVLLEATYLTGAYGFAAAVEEGRAKMLIRADFDSLLDINLARNSTPPVTPLAIIHE